MPTPQRALPTILFGAFDRHNLGDILFPHIAARLLDRESLLFAGLAERDLSSVGGYRTRSISQLAKDLGKQPINLLHVGGELLTCSAWQAAVMVQPPEQVQLLVQRLEGRDEERDTWVRGVLGNTGLAPYTVPRELLPGLVHLIYTAVGGVELMNCVEPFRAEVLAKLGSADYVSVRDQRTWAHLNQLGIQAHLVPDPAVLVAELFGEQIERSSQEGEVSAMQASFPCGYVAFQFSADFGDDATLAVIAAQLEQVAEESGFGIVLFRAGAAPWHDDLACYRRLAGEKSTRVRVFSSLDVWEICALIAHSRAFCGSSLHGRIVAMAYGLPRVNLSHPQYESRTGKQAAYAATWELPGNPLTVGIAGIATGVQQALSADPDQLLIHSQALASKYLESFTTILALLDHRADDPG